MKAIELLFKLIALCEGYLNYYGTPGDRARFAKIVQDAQRLKAEA